MAILFNPWNAKKENCFTFWCLFLESSSSSFACIQGTFLIANVDCEKKKTHSRHISDDTNQCQQHSECFPVCLIFSLTIITSFVIEFVISNVSPWPHCHFLFLCLACRQPCPLGSLCKQFRLDSTAKVHNPWQYWPLNQWTLSSDSYSACNYQSSWEMLMTFVLIQSKN